MARIADHHLTGRRDQDLYRPSKPWPDDCYVQWGDVGLVVREKGESYTTAFFESFPGNTFIRGEGSTLSEAEAHAFAQYERDRTCDHVWGRGTYTNGCAVCRRCGGFRTKMFPPIVKLGDWRRPISQLEHSSLEMERNGDRERYGLSEPSSSTKRHLRRAAIRERLFGVEPSRGLLRDFFAR